RLPTSVLPTGITPFEAFKKVKPDLSVARIFGCFCYVSVPRELRPKGGLKRFVAIFVGYIEDRLGWLTVNLKGKEFFSRDVIFDELRPGRLGVPRAIHPPDSALPAPPPNALPEISDSDL
ncbi:hypothetical protein B0H34DRAFT_631241, partial [Crassisporium funariophilum]